MIWAKIVRWLRGDWADRTRTPIVIGKTTLEEIESCIDIKIEPGATTIPSLPAGMAIEDFLDADFIIPQSGGSMVAGFTGTKEDADRIIATFRSRINR